MSLADRLSRFNKVANIPSKHFSAQLAERSNLDERTFSIHETALAFAMMRQMSIELFELLDSKGKKLPTEWKQFRDAWLIWDKRIERGGTEAQ
jgi:hypothetical protein